MLGDLWTRANEIIGQVLQGAADKAMSLLNQARNQAFSALGEVGNQLLSLYEEARGTLGAIGDAIGVDILSAIDSAIVEVQAAADAARQLVDGILGEVETALQSLVDATKQALDETWDEFGEFASEVREAVGVFDSGVTGAENASEVEEGGAIDEGEAQVEAESVEAGGEGSSTDTATEPAAESAPETAPQEATLPSGSTKEAAKGFVTATPTEKASLWPQMGDGMKTAAQNEETEFKGGLEPLELKLSGELEPGTESAKLDKPSGELQTDAPGTPEEVTLEEKGDQGPPVISPATNPSYGEDSDYRDRAREVASSINSVDTTDQDVDTDPGPAPDIPLTGATDPTQLTDAGKSADEEGTKAVEEATQALLDSPGVELVQPIEVDEEYAIEGLKDAEVAANSAVSGMEKYVAYGLTGDVSAKFDELNGPAMEAALGDFQSQVDSATTERDTAREQAISDAEAEVERVQTDAQTKQEAEVTAQRDAISKERQAALDKQQKAIGDVRSEAAAEHSKAMGDIDSRVAADQRKINDEFAKAKRDAESEVKAGERKAEEEKRKKEEEANNRSWWQKAVSFVADCLKALTEAITKIFDAVRKAVTAIIDAVATLAKGLIDIACKFICSVIEAYGALLKGLIQNLIGAILPELADALCAFVDDAVKAATDTVKEIAELAKASIDKAAQFLKDSLDALLDTFLGALNAAITFAEAVLTGDWEKVFRMVLEAALQLAGIPPEEFFGYVGEAESTLTTIIDDPGAFVGNAIDAAGQGFSQFGDNFLDHLQSGFLEWLTGAAGEVGIEIPDSFDASAIFSIAMQVMGLTGENLRAKAVEHLGEENVELIEQVWGFVSAAIEGGLEGLWAHVEEYLVGIYDEVVDQIKEWLLEKVVMKAITKIASMFNPVAALVQALITAWNVYSFLKDKGPADLRGRHLVHHQPVEHRQRQPRSGGRRHRGCPRQPRAPRHRSASPHPGPRRHRPEGPGSHRGHPGEGRPGDRQAHREGQGHVRRQVRRRCREGRRRRRRGREEGRRRDRREDLVLRRRRGPPPLDRRQRRDRHHHGRVEPDAGARPALPHEGAHRRAREGPGR